jgi:hypothetical protein
VELLVRSLVGHSGLTRINLTGNEVGGRGVAALVALIDSPNSSLVDLTLERCALNDEGAVILAEGLGRLRILNLSENGDVT